MNNTKAHEELKHSILIEFGSSPVLRIWPNNTGAIKTKNRFIKFGLKGSADILGILFDGRFLAIEVKTGKSRLSESQQKFKKMIEKMNGIYIEARSINDIRNFLDSLGYLI